MLHTLRSWLANDEQWREILRGLQSTFRHQTVTTIQIEEYIAKQFGKDLKPFFDQYLRDTRIPVLEYKYEGKKLQYRYSKIVPGFTMPVKVKINAGDPVWITPNANWQDYKQNSNITSFEPDPNFYITSKKVSF